MKNRKLLILLGVCGVIAAASQPTIKFTNVSKIVFKHNLKTKAPHIHCINEQGESLDTWNGPRILDENTIEYTFSQAVSGSCTAAK